MLQFQFFFIFMLKIIHYNLLMYNFLSQTSKLISKINTKLIDKSFVNKISQKIEGSMIRNKQISILKLSVKYNKNVQMIVKKYFQTDKKKQFKTNIVKIQSNNQHGVTKQQKNMILVFQANFLNYLLYYNLMQKGKQGQKIATQLKKSLYIHTGWFQTADNQAVKEILDQEFSKLEIEFNSYGIIDQNNYFTKYYKILCGILQNYSKKLTDFKFKFIGWDQVNPLYFQQIINRNIKTDHIYLNYSNIRGSQKLLECIIKKLFQAQSKYISIHLNFSNWKMNFDSFKSIQKYHMINDTKKFHLQISGWGKNIYQFFKIKQPTFKMQQEQKKQIKAQVDQNLIQFNIFLREFFIDQLTNSVTEQIKLDMRYWHEAFKLKDLKTSLDNFLKDGFQQQSLISMNVNPKPVFKFIFVI